jgi:hypothetical protein
MGIRFERQTFQSKLAHRRPRDADRVALGAAFLSASKLNTGRALDGCGVTSQTRDCYSAA